MTQNVSLDYCFDQFVKGGIDEDRLEAMLTRHLENYCGITPFCPGGENGQAGFLGRFCALLLRAAANCREGFGLSPQ